MDKISIVITVYNKELWLKRCLDSVINQTYTNLEIIVVNNASTDNSSYIINDYAKLDKRIIVTNIHKNIGPANGIKRGFEIASGEFVGCVDSDDYIDPNYIEVLHDAIIRTQSDVAMCVNDLVWEDGRKWHKEWPVDKFLVIDNGDAIKHLPHQLLDELNNHYYGQVIPEIGVEWGKLYRRELLLKYDIEYDISLWQYCDWVFNMKVMKNVKRIVITQETVYHFFQSPSSVTRRTTYDIQHIKRYIQSVSCMYEIIQDIPEIEPAYNKFVFRIMSLITSYLKSFLFHGVSISQFCEVLNEVNKSESIKCAYNSKNREFFNIEESKSFQLMQFPKRYIVAYFTKKITRKMRKVLNW